MAVPYMRHEVITLFSHDVTFVAAWAIVILIPALWFFAELKKENMQHQWIKWICFVIVIAFGIYWGGRILYTAGPWGGFNYKNIFNVSGGGNVLYGGLIGGFLLGFLYLKGIKEKNTGKICDMCAQVFPLADFVGRLVWCFYLGDDFGIPSTLPWAIEFLGPGYNYLMNRTLHPVQLYLSLGSLLVFVLLFEVKKRKKWDGEVFAWSLVLYGVIRFFIEYLRDTTESPAVFLGGVLFTYSQLISVVLILIGGSILLYKRKKVISR